MKRKLLGLMVLGVLAFALPAVADPITFTTGNGNNGTYENIQFSQNTSGSTIYGVTNQSHTQITFHSATDILNGTASGQADITAQDGLINNLTISVTSGMAFMNFILNPEAAKKHQPVVTVIAHTSAGDQSFTYTLGTGNNYLTIAAANGIIINSLTLNSNEGFNELKQPRIGEFASPVPEPASLMLFGTGLAGIFTRLRRKRK